MATVKNTSDNYTITVANGVGLMTINANLDVVGNITYIDSSELRVTDPFITVAYENNGAVQSMGLVAQKTTTTWAGLRFNTASGDWEISDSVDAEGGPITPYAPIASGNVTTNPGLPDTSIQFNQGNTFAGNSAFTFDPSTAKVGIVGQIAYGNIATAPAVTANSVALYHNAQGAGGTGLYFKSATGEDELISRSKAVTFSLIF